MNEVLADLRLRASHICAGDLYVNREGFYEYKLAVLKRVQSCIQQFEVEILAAAQ